MTFAPRRWTTSQSSAVSWVRPSSTVVIMSREAGHPASRKPDQSCRSVAEAGSGRRRRDGPTAMRLTLFAANGKAPSLRSSAMDSRTSSG